MKFGVYQGLILSPSLFVKLLDEALKEKMGYALNAMLFVVDMVFDSYYVARISRQGKR